MLKCEKNTPAIENEVLTTARKCFKDYPIEDNRIFTIVCMKGGFNRKD